MADIILYTKPTCPYCSSAKTLFDSKKAPYKEISIAGNNDLREEMIAKANGKSTVPQIFIGDTHVGGCDDLYELDDAGKLTALLAS